jgi:methyl-accepting chemotaxis protein
MIAYFHSLRFKITLVSGWSILCLSSLALLAERTWLTGSVALAGFLGALIGARHLIKVMCGGLNRQTGKFNEMANFLDFSKRSASPRKDEFGRSAAAFDRFLTRVEDTVGIVVISAASVATATREIAAGNMDLSNRTEQQATSLERTAFNMQQLTETVRKNSNSAIHADTLATDAAKLAVSGRESVTAMADTIGRISQSANHIAEISTLIDSIAFQTNILALNAAVEAARAGEQGRGFAVVAHEVRNLAHRSSAAAKEIKNLTDNAVDLVRAGREQAVKAGITVEQVQEAIHAVSTVVGEISDGAVVQRDGIEEIGIAVAHLDQVTQQNAALVEQVAAAAQSLEEQAGKLTSVVSVFKVSRAPSANLNAPIITPLNTNAKTIAVALPAAPKLRVLRG